MGHLLRTKYFCCVETTIYYVFRIPSGNVMFQMEKSSSKWEHVNTVQQSREVHWNIWVTRCAQNNAAVSQELLLAFSSFRAVMSCSKLARAVPCGSASFQLCTDVFLGYKNSYLQHKHTILCSIRDLYVAEHGSTEREWRALAWSCTLRLEKWGYH